MRFRVTLLKSLIFTFALMFLNLQVWSQKGKMEYGVRFGFMLSGSSSDITLSNMNLFYGGYASYHATDWLSLSTGVELQGQGFRYENPDYCNPVASYVFSLILIGGGLLEEPDVCDEPKYLKEKIYVGRFPVIVSLNLSEDFSNRTQTYLALGYAYGRVLSFDKNIYEDYQYDLPLRRNLHYGIVGLEFKSKGDEITMTTGAYVEFTRLDYYLFGRVYNYSLGFRLGF